MTRVKHLHDRGYKGSTHEICFHESRPAVAGLDGGKENKKGKGRRKSKKEEPKGEGNMSVYQPEKYTWLGRLQCRGGCSYIKGKGPRRRGEFIRGPWRGKESRSPRSEMWTLVYLGCRFFLESAYGGQGGK